MVDQIFGQTNKNPHFDFVSWQGFLFYFNKVNIIWTFVGLTGWEDKKLWLILQIWSCHRLGMKLFSKESFFIVFCKMKNNARLKLRPSRIIDLRESRCSSCLLDFYCFMVVLELKFAFNFMILVFKKLVIQFIIGLSCKEFHAPTQLKYI